MNKLKNLSNLNITNRLYKSASFLFEKVNPTPIKSPKLIHFNQSLLDSLDLSIEEFSKSSMLNFLNGDLEFEGVEFKSSYYSGHQFGHFVPRLGDGRAIKLFEIKSSQNKYLEFQLKGAGLTPFSRMGDGRAVFRSSLREYLCSANMSALNIKTTEALSLIEGSDKVYREELETSAIVLRISESFLRFGHFEFLYFHNKHDELKILVDFVIDSYFESFKSMPNKYVLFFQEVTKRTAKLIASWQAIGFCHGVMNTDNMSILGLTIDYGPFGFIDKLDLDFICNHSDHEGRYSFGNQPHIGLWNLEKLAIALSPLITKEQSDLVLSTYEKIFHVEYQTLLRRKFGLSKVMDGDESFFKNALNMLVITEQDYTIFFRNLCNYKLDQMVDVNQHYAYLEFLKQYNLRLRNETNTDDEREKLMKLVNPKYVLRNYLAQICLDDKNKINDMFKVISSPFEEWSEFDSWSNQAPVKYQSLSVSCSS